jgi:hypothetical protein
MQPANSSRGAALPYTATWSWPPPRQCPTRDEVFEVRAGGRQATYRINLKGIGASVAAVTVTTADVMRCQPTRPSLCDLHAPTSAIVSSVRRPESAI